MKLKLLAFGINHKSAPLAIREQAIFTPDTAAAAVRELMHLPAVNEAIILSTCNRTELYTDCTDIELLTHWLAERHHIPKDTLMSCLYSHQDQQAIAHILRVASGLDSMVLGEPQIFGQLKQAVAIAQQAGALSGQLGRLFQMVFATTKQVRTDTGIGVNPVSMAYAVIDLAKRIFSHITTSTVLLIGAGEMIELATAHLYSQGVTRLIIANRSPDKAWHLAIKFQAKAIALVEIPAYLHQADMVVTATASQLPILGKGLVETALKQRKHRPMLMVDMAVPRNVEPEVAALEDIYLYNIDDLQTIIAENLKSRQAAANQAEAIIATQVTHFMHELHAARAVATIRAYRNKIEDYAAKELLQAQQQLRQGESAQHVLQMLAHNLTQKITHIPSVELRKAAYEGQFELLALAQRLFGIQADDD